MGEVAPGVASFAVVLPDGAPLSVAEIRAPLPPGDVIDVSFLQAFSLGRSAHDRLPLSPLRASVIKLRSGDIVHGSK